MEDLRVPTLRVDCEILYGQGQQMRGWIFLPMSSHANQAPPRAEDWFNEASSFFAFIPENRTRAVLLSKEHVQHVRIAVTSDAGTIWTENPIVRRAYVECEGFKIEGDVAFALPENHSRLIDFLNSSGRFVGVWQEDSLHLIRKNSIVKVYEPEEA